MENLPELVDDWTLEDAMLDMDENAWDMSDHKIVLDLMEFYEFDNETAKSVLAYWKKVRESRRKWVVVYFKHTIPLVTLEYYVKGGVLDLNNIRFFPKTTSEANELVKSLNERKEGKNDKKP